MSESIKEEIETILGDDNPKLRPINLNLGRKAHGNELTRTWSKARKIAGAKYLRKEEGLTYKSIGEWLGISDDSAERYVKLYQLPDDQMVKFDEEFKAVMRLMQMDGLGKVQSRLLQLVPKERKISEVVKAGEFYKGGGNTNVQVNIATMLDRERKQFDFDE